MPGSEGVAVAGSPAERASAAVVHHCRRLIDSAGSACVAVKLQLACFERLGPPGWLALWEVAAVAREAGLLVIADGKRGDVPLTAEVYAQALIGTAETPWGEIDGLGADAITVNPLLGRDSLLPFVERAARAGAGLFVLVRTSNPGAAELQDLAAGGEPLHARLAALVDGLGSEELGTLGAGGLSDVGAVVGATEPGHIGALRELMPRAIFLIPGVGAQGGRPEDLRPALGAQRASILVAASRSIALAHEQTGGEPESAAASAAQTLRNDTWGLGE